MISFKSKYRVYFKDTDTGGVVYHARYVEFMEMSRTDFFHSCGYSIRGILEEERVVFPVTELSIRYLRPASLDDVLEVGLEVRDIRGAKIFFSYRICNQDGELLAEASTVNAVVDVDKQRPLRAEKVIPDIVRRVDKK